MKSFVVAGVVASIVAVLSSKNKGIKLHRNEVQTHEEVKKCLYSNVFYYKNTERKSFLRKGTEHELNLSGMN